MNTEFALTAVALAATHALLDAPRRRYVVRVIGPAGRVTYLDHDCEVETTADAWHYADAHRADREGERYVKRSGQLIAHDVIDLDNEEAGAVL